MTIAWRESATVVSANITRMRLFVGSKDIGNPGRRSKLPAPGASELVMGGRLTFIKLSCSIALVDAPAKRRACSESFGLADRTGAVARPGSNTVLARAQQSPILSRRLCNSSLRLTLRDTRDHSGADRLMKEQHLDIAAKDGAMNSFITCPEEGTHARLSFSTWMRWLAAVL